MGNGITATNPSRITAAGDPGPNTVRIYSDANHDVRLLEQDGTPLPTALRVPVGTNDERPNSTGASTTVTVEAQPGHIRYNTDEQAFEGFTGADNATGEWEPIGGLKEGDVGTNPNQIPLNQMLGQMAFVDNVATLRPFSNTAAQPVFNGEPQPVFVGEGDDPPNGDYTNAGLCLGIVQHKETVVDYNLLSPAMKLTDYPNELPAITLDFQNSRQLDPRVTFKRASDASQLLHQVLGNS